MYTKHFLYYLILFLIQEKNNNKRKSQTFNIIKQTTDTYNVHCKYFVECH